MTEAYRRWWLNLVTENDKFSFFSFTQKRPLKGKIKPAMTNIDPIKCCSSMEEKLRTQHKIRIGEIENRTGIAPNAPGVYLIYDKEEIGYVGETGNLKGRMKDMLRSLTSSF